MCSCYALGHGLSDTFFRATNGIEGRFVLFVSILKAKRCDKKKLKEDLSIFANSAPSYFVPGDTAADSVGLIFLITTLLVTVLGILMIQVTGHSPCPSARG